MTEGCIKRQSNDQALQSQLEKSPDKQLSTTDADARALVTGQNIVEVGYSTQVATDAKHKPTGYYHKKGGYRAKHYKTPACKDCPVRQQYTISKTGRVAQRSEYQDYIDVNRNRVENTK
ncbi:MAG: hypothetical protein H6573_26115 [Lewinellaceae bacterium]|nr:hypothetical protein [Lewinellaceae bacterium]